MRGTYPKEQGGAEAGGGRQGQRTSEGWEGRDVQLAPSGCMAWHVAWHDAWHDAWHGAWHGAWHDAWHGSSHVLPALHPAAVPPLPLPPCPGNCHAMSKPDMQGGRGGGGTCLLGR